MGEHRLPRQETAEGAAVGGWLNDQKVLYRKQLAPDHVRALDEAMPG